MKSVLKNIDDQFLIIKAAIDTNGQDNNNKMKK